MAAANIILGVQIVLGFAMLAVMAISRFGSQPLKDRLSQFYRSQISHWA